MVNTECFTSLKRREDRKPGFVRAWVARLGMARPGVARHGRKGEARRGMAGRGKSWQEGRGVVWQARRNKMIYQWKDGSRFAADAGKVALEIESIKGPKKPEAVLDIARDEKTELHKCFEWDDGEAAEAYRLEQARTVLRRISIVREIETPQGEKTIVVRAYENVNMTPDAETPNRAYVSVSQALSIPNLRMQVFGRLNKTIDEARATAENYSYLAEEMGEVKAGLTRAHRAVKRALSSGKVAAMV